MQFVGVKEKKGLRLLQGKERRRHLVRIEVEEREKELYQHSISFYDTPPDTTLSLIDFDKYALTRLKVLRIIERINLTSVAKFSIDWAKAIEADLRKQSQESQEIHHFYTLFSLSDPEEMLAARKYDHISHYLLRLAFARTEEQRKWFIALEMDFFHLKLNFASSLERIRFLEFHKFPGKKISDDEANNMKLEISAASYMVGGRQYDGEVFKVPFLYALDLVRQRKVLLRAGLVYVPFNELTSIICSSFRSYLSESISIVKKNMYLIEQDQRIVQVIEDFDQRHTGNEFASKKGNSSAVTAAQLPTLSQKSFPLCMKSLYDVVTKDHHLKHFGRLQLGLFFKALGVPMDEATNFWRGEFTKRPEIDGTRFDKQYLYNIRHMYGQEGKRADYTPYSCMKIITSSVGAGDHHGCPFKHSDQSNLRTKLVDAQIPPTGIKEILDLIEGHHYQIACQKYFEWTHDKMTVEGGVNHPNQYFEESRAVLGGKKTIKAEEKVKTKRTNVYADGRTSSQSQQVKKEESTEEMSPELEPEEQMEIDDDDNADVELIMASIKY